MSNLDFSYQMEIKFSMPVIKHCFSLRCLPFDDECQKISNLIIEVSPQNLLTETADGFGNRVITDRIIEPHSEFNVNISGSAEIDVSKREKSGLNGIYKYQSQYTADGDEIFELCNDIELTGDSIRDVTSIMKKLHKTFSYKSSVTDVSTTAEQALKLGYGVCQDFSHILISACRYLYIPARYVVGIIKGVGETHAWVEVYIKGQWVGVDPTNNKLADDYYLKLSHGRDFGDCSVNRGLFIGGGTQTQKIIAELK